MKPSTELLRDVRAYLDEHYDSSGRRPVRGLVFPDAVLLGSCDAAPFGPPAAASAVPPDAEGVFGPAPIALEDLDYSPREAPGLSPDAAEGSASPVDADAVSYSAVPLSPPGRERGASRGLPGRRRGPFDRGGFPARPAADSLDEILQRRDETFSEALLLEIDARGLSDPQVYKRANIDRKLFSKIRTNAQYQPKKSTAVALALALQMNLDETLDLIGRAGYTLSSSSKADLIVAYFIERECWDVNVINQVLYEFDQPLVGR